MLRVLVLAALLVGAAWAEACGRDDLFGAYGFRLAGTTTISGEPRPLAVIGRVVFEADRHVSGTSSVNFNGLFLGNPVTGNYDFRTDCSLTFEFQDDSGGWQ